MEQQTNIKGFILISAIVHSVFLAYPMLKAQAEQAPAITITLKQAELPTMATQPIEKASTTAKASARNKPQSIRKELEPPKQSHSNNDRANIIQSVEQNSTAEIQDLAELTKREVQRDEGRAKVTAPNQELNKTIAANKQQLQHLLDNKRHSMKPYEMHSKAIESYNLAYEVCFMNLQLNTYEGMMFEFRANPENWHKQDFIEKAFPAFNKADFEKDMTFTYDHIQDEDWLKERINNKVQKAKSHLSKVYSLDIQAFNQPNLREDLLNVAITAKTFSRSQGGNNDVEAATGARDSSYFLLVAGLTEQEAMEKLIKQEKISLIERGKDSFHLVRADIEARKFLQQANNECNPIAEKAKKIYLYK